MCSLAVDGEYAIHFPEARVEELRAHGHPLPIPIRDGNRPFVDQEVIQQKVEEGDYLLIIAGDQLERRAVRLSNAVLGRHVIRGWDLALVEVAVFEQKGNAGSKEYLLVPHLGGALAVEQRHVVHVVIDEKRTRVEVEERHGAVVVNRHLFRGAERFYLAPGYAGGRFSQAPGRNRGTQSP